MSVRWGERPERADGVADPVLLRSAVVNAVQNAIQAVASGGNVVLAVHRGDDGWELRVDDDGAGLGDGDPEELFRPFVTNRAGGNGLGLVIARGALRAMGGDLRLERRDGGGARARFVLPDPGTDAAAPEPAAT